MSRIYRLLVSSVTAMAHAKGLLKGLSEHIDCYPLTVSIDDCCNELDKKIDAIIESIDGLEKESCNQL